MNDNAELMQTTVGLTWNKPEWLLPEPQTADEEYNGIICVLLSCGNTRLCHEGRYQIKSGKFTDKQGNDHYPSNVDFWAYMPKHPTK